MLAKRCHFSLLRWEKQSCTRWFCTVGAEPVVGRLCTNIGVGGEPISPLPQHHSPLTEAIAANLCGSCRVSGAKNRYRLFRFVEGEGGGGGKHGSAQQRRASATSTATRRLHSVPAIPHQVFFFALFFLNVRCVSESVVGVSCQNASWRAASSLRGRTTRRVNGSVRSSSLFVLLHVNVPPNASVNAALPVPSPPALY